MKISVRRLEIQYPNSHRLAILDREKRHEVKLNIRVIAMKERVKQMVCKKEQEAYFLLGLLGPGLHVYQEFWSSL